MVQYWFEVFRQANDRWSWQFVEFRGGRPRVLARSGRDYRSRKRARLAVRKFTEGIAGAQILPGAGGYQLPASRFAVDYNVVPLMAGVSRRGYKPKKRRQREREAQAAPAEVQAPAQPAAQATALTSASEPEMAARTARAARTKSPGPDAAAASPKRAR
jgi:hypothetical protein